MIQKKKNNLEIIDGVIKQIFTNFIDYNKLNKDKPLSVNIQFSEDMAETEVYEDMDSLVIADDHVYITLYTPYNLNKLRFDINEKEQKLMIKSHDYLFYKEFWFNVPVIKSTLSTSFRNNILELKLNRKED